MIVYSPKTSFLPSSHWPNSLARWARLSFANVMYFWKTVNDPLWILRGFHVSMLWIWNMCLSGLIHAQNPPSNENYDLYPNMWMTNHIFIPCCWLIVLHLYLSWMRTRNYKILWRQSSCHPTNLVYVSSLGHKMSI